MKNGQNREM